jgi:predicted component of type VI protein secretion system
MTPLEAGLARQARRFDPVCLVRTLLHLGYGFGDIRFRSHFSACSQSSLVEAIEFLREPRRAIVTLNLGLLGGQSILPSYLFKQVHDDGIDAARFAEFFGYFDDRLLRRFLLAVYPEMDSDLYPDWEGRKRGGLFTLKLDCVAVLHWLMRRVFPELQVRVEKAALTRGIEMDAPVLGKTRLGYQAVFGKRVDLPVPGSRITLIAEEDDFAAGQPWPQEIERRLRELVFPLLRGAGVDLEIWLVIRAQRGWLRLEQNSYLGYEGMMGGRPGFRRILIFSGRLFDWH